MTDILSRNEKAWVDFMMVEELGLMPEEEDPLKAAVALFVAF